MTKPHRLLAQWMFGVALVLGAVVGFASGLIVVELAEGGLARVRDAWSLTSPGVGAAESQAGLMGTLLGLAVGYRTWRTWVLKTGAFEHELRRVIPF